MKPFSRRSTQFSVFLLKYVRLSPKVLLDAEWEHVLLYNLCVPFSTDHAFLDVQAANSISTGPPT